MEIDIWNVVLFLYKQQEAPVMEWKIRNKKKIYYESVDY